MHATDNNFQNINVRYFFEIIASRMCLFICSTSYLKYAKIQYDKSGNKIRDLPSVILFLNITNERKKIKEAKENSELCDIKINFITKLILH